jgi:hypothetical protein
MNATVQSNLTCLPSAAARRRMLGQFGEPLFIAGWHDVLMIHFEVDAAALQRDVPFELDLRDGRAFVSLVAFTMREMRPRFGGKWTALLFRPIATHHFLNVRTYVRHGGECGIHFLAEWLTSRLAVMLGPRTFGLPYRYGRISYLRDLEKGDISGRVEDAKGRASLRFEGRITNSNDTQAREKFGQSGNSALPQIARERRPTEDFRPCAAGSLDEWLMERYIAFNSANRVRRFFRVWHPPWPQRPVNVELGETSLVATNWPWFDEARMVGANFSPGFDTVWMGRPNTVT